MKRVTLILTLALVCVSTACSFLGSEDSPEKGAKEWAQALADQDRNRVMERTCAAQQENVVQPLMWLALTFVFDERMVGQEGKIDVSDLKFTIVKSSGDTADVRVTEQVQAGGPAPSSQTQDVATWRMVREDGKWKWCKP